METKREVQHTQASYTIPEILRGVVMVSVMLGGLLSTWNILNDKIITQEISFKLTSEQEAKEIQQLQENIKDLRKDLDIKSKDVKLHYESGIAINEKEIEKLITRIDKMEVMLSEVFYSRGKPIDYK